MRPVLIYRIEIGDKIKEFKGKDRIFRDVNHIVRTKKQLNSYRRRVKAIADKHHGSTEIYLKYTTDLNKFKEKEK